MNNNSRYKKEIEVLCEDGSTFFIRSYIDDPLSFELQIDDNVCCIDQSILQSVIEDVQKDEDINDIAEDSFDSPLDNDWR